MKRRKLNALHMMLRYDCHDTILKGNCYGYIKMLAMQESLPSLSNALAVLWDFRWCCVALHLQHV